MVLSQGVVGTFELATLLFMVLVLVLVLAFPLL